MNLQFNQLLGTEYKSGSQRIRVITEDWVGENLYCPYCGQDHISHFENNRPVADFFCPKCSEEFELKSNSKRIEGEIQDGAYATMLNRIQSVNNPNLFLMKYSSRNMSVEDFMIVPKYFFVEDIVIKRKPLAATARRAGWTGCKIAIDRVPDEGKIYLIKESRPISCEEVIQKVRKTHFIAKYKLDARGWILDVLNCLGKIPENEFTLDKVYSFADDLQVRHPDNHHVHDKIRQQLQLLRDKGIIEFVGRGRYKKI